MSEEEQNIPVREFIERASYTKRAVGIYRGKIPEGRNNTFAGKNVICLVTNSDVGDFATDRYPNLFDRQDRDPNARAIWAYPLLDEDSCVSSSHAFACTTTEEDMRRGLERIEIDLEKNLIEGVHA
jgi:hypothetical protein